MLCVAEKKGLCRFHQQQTTRKKGKSSGSPARMTSSPTRGEDRPIGAQTGVRFALPVVCLATHVPGEINALFEYGIKHGNLGPTIKSHKDVAERFWLMAMWDEFDEKDRRMSTLINGTHAFAGPDVKREVVGVVLGRFASGQN